MPLKPSCSWILKAIIHQRETLTQIPDWQQMRCKIITRKVYNFMRVDYPVVDWKVTVYGNIARPRAIFIFWLAWQPKIG
jgi:hypothetical protein